MSILASLACGSPSLGNGWNHLGGECEKSGEPRPRFREKQGSEPEAEMVGGEPGASSSVSCRIRSYDLI